MNVSLLLLEERALKHQPSSGDPSWSCWRGEPRIGLADVGLGKDVAIRIHRVRHLKSSSEKQLQMKNKRIESESNTNLSAERRQLLDHSFHRLGVDWELGDLHSLILKMGGDGAGEGRLQHLVAVPHPRQITYTNSSARSILLALYISTGMASISSGGTFSLWRNM